MLEDRRLKIEDRRSIFHPLSSILDSRFLVLRRFTVLSMPSRGLAVSHQLSRALIRLAMLLLTRTHVYGHKLAPRKGGAVVVCNHIAAVDPAILVGVFPRPLVLMSKIENARGVLKFFM